MRLHLKINTTNQIVPFEHQALLTGTIHKWLGINEEHGNISLYSFSQLEGGKATPMGLKFERDTNFFFSSFHTALIKKIVTGIQKDSHMFCGLSVVEITIQEDPDLSNRELFFAASPIFIKKRMNDRTEHIKFDNPHAGTYLKETLLTKMERVGIYDDTLELHFDDVYPKATTKLITYNKVKNRANWCPVIIKGKPETKIFAWNVGLGHSTGIGFGAIK